MHPWLNLVAVLSFAAFNATVYSLLLTPDFFKSFVAHIPVVGDDPFVHVSAPQQEKKRKKHNKRAIGF